jgi:hypothetical protein
MEHGARDKVNPDDAKIPYRRVGFAHQTSLISSVKGGQSPPYANDAAISHGCVPVTTFQLRFIPVLIGSNEHFPQYLCNYWVRRMDLISRL